MAEEIDDARQAKPVEKSQDQAGIDYSTKFDEIFSRLKQAVGAKADNELGEALGLRQQTISAAKSKKQIPAGWIVEISAKFGISADWILYGDGPVRRDERSRLGVAIAFPGHSEENRKFVTLETALPRLNENKKLTVVKNSWEFWFDESELNNLDNRDALVAMRMPGNDMYPVIKDKDTIVIDTSIEHVKDIISGALYAVSIGDMFLIRYLAPFEDRIALTGNNCKSTTVEPSKINIHGRVVQSRTSL